MSDPADPRGECAAGSVEYSRQARQGDFVWMKADAGSAGTVTMSFDGKEVPCYTNGDGKRDCYASVLPDTQPGNKKLLLKADGKTHVTRTIKIVRRGFPLLPLTLTNDKKALLNGEDRADEIQKIRAALHTESAERLRKSLFELPVKGTIESQFGEKRTVDGKTRPGFHRGLDIGVPEGTLISAPSDGRVVLAGMFTEEGNMVMLDHGQGIVTAYLHLSEIIAQANTV